MNNFLKEGRDFKIIPDKFVNATTFDIQEIDDATFIAKLNSLDKKQLDAYMPGSEVEIFGVSGGGLIYFTTKIVAKDEASLTLDLPDEHKDIQRREYSRISTNSKLLLNAFKNQPFKTIDISAGGLRFYSNSDLEIGEEYEALLRLTNNLEIECSIQVIRIHDDKSDKNFKCAISARFKEIRSIDRIALAQYTFKTLTEEENKIK